jgi:hypothetical protein
VGSAGGAAVMVAVVLAGVYLTVTSMVMLSAAGGTAAAAAASSARPDCAGPANPGTSNTWHEDAYIPQLLLGSLFASCTAGNMCAHCRRRPSGDPTLTAVALQVMPMVFTAC